MFGELLKILADEPEKISKVFIRLFKIILTLIFSVFSFKYLFSKSPYFNITDYKNWIDFIENGKIFVYVLLYLACEFILFQILASLFSFIPSLFARLRISLLNDKDLAIVLRFLGVLKIDKETNRYLPGRNFNDFYSLVDLFREEDSREEIVSLKKSFIQNIWNLYTVSFFVFIVTGAFTYWDKKVFWFSLSGIALLLFFYIYIHHLIEFLVKNYRNLSFDLQRIKIQKAINDTLSEYYIIPERAEKSSGLKKGEVFYINGREYVLNFIYSDNEPSLSDIKSYVLKNDRNDRFFLFISNLNTIETVSPIDLFNMEILTYEDEKDLVARIKEFLKTHKRYKGQIR